MKEPDQQSADSLSMSRRVVVLALAAVLLGGHLIAIIFNIDSWPISCYPMFNRLQRQKIRMLVVYGVTDSGDEIRLLGRAYWRPVSPSQLLAMLKAEFPLSRPNANVGEMEAIESHDKVLAPLAATYERNRKRGRHHGPPVKAIRIYEFIWQLDPQLRNLNDHKMGKLLAEYRQNPLEKTNLAGQQR